MIINNLKTSILLLSLTAVLVVLGSFIGGTSGVYTMLIVALMINGITFFFSDKIVLRLYGATPLDNNKYHAIHTIIEELSTAMRLPMPKLWLVNMSTPNAFATGRSPRHASIGLTPSIISLLNENELRGVLAHELSHIKNRDTLVTTIAAVIGTAIGYLAYLLRNAALWGSLDSSRKKNNNVFVLIALSIITPLIATIIRLAISRSREYLADETASYNAHPLALASALEKLELYSTNQKAHEQQMQHAALASLCIVNPFCGASFATLFSTHPPTHKRIERLETMYQQKYNL